MWEAECARVPEFSESAFHIITGLLLPIWDRLPADNMRVYRFETEDGERVIGRLVTPEALDRVYKGLGVNGAPAPDQVRAGLSHQEAWNAVIERGAVLDLAGELQIRRSLVMSAHRVELTGFTDGMVPQLKALGPHLRNHRLAPAALRTGRGRSRPGDRSQHSSTAIRSSAPMPALPPDPDMCRDQPPPIWRAASRATPRPCAAIISPKDIAAAVTGSSAMS